MSTGYLSKGIIVSLFSCFSVSVFSFPTRCECGDFPTGITTWYVPEGDGCCDSVAPIAGTIYYYEQNTFGNWVEVGHDGVSGVSAQGRCCQPL